MFRSTLSTPQAKTVSSKQKPQDLIAKWQKSSEPDEALNKAVTSFIQSEKDLLFLSKLHAANRKKTAELFEKHPEILQKNIDVSAFKISIVDDIIDIDMDCAEFLLKYSETISLSLEQEELGQYLSALVSISKKHSALLAKSFNKMFTSILAADKTDHMALLANKNLDKEVSDLIRFHIAKALLKSADSNADPRLFNATTTKNNHSELIALYIRAYEYLLDNDDSDAQPLIARVAQVLTTGSLPNSNASEASEHHDLATMTIHSTIAPEFWQYYRKLQKVNQLVCPKIINILLDIADTFIEAAIPHLTPSESAPSAYAHPEDGEHQKSTTDAYTPRF